MRRPSSRQLTTWAAVTRGNVLPSYGLRARYTVGTVATHDILVYDDDALRGNLETRCKIANDALDMLRGSLPDDDPIVELTRGAEIAGFGTREDLLQAIERRNKSDWAIALIDLQDADGSMRGARIIRTIRDNPELRLRCMPVALTVHANPAMQRALRPWAFALVAMGSTRSAAHLSDALVDLYGRQPSAEAPGCSPYPEADEPDASRAYAENFYRRFKVHPRLGDDLVISHIDRDIPGTVTDARLHAQSAASGGQWRRSVADFKDEVAHANDWGTASVARMVRAFLADMVRLDFDDPINPQEINTAGGLWRNRSTRLRTRIPVAAAPVLDAFFSEFETQVALSTGSPQNAGMNEHALVVARASVAKRHQVSEDWIVYALHVLLDLAQEPA